MMDISKLRLAILDCINSGMSNVDIADWLESYTVASEIAGFDTSWLVAVIRLMAEESKIVRISVEGGAAEVDEIPSGVEVIIRDYDTDGTEEASLEDDHGTYVESRYG